jgi:hypothetical protein
VLGTPPPHVGVPVPAPQPPLDMPRLRRRIGAALRTPRLPELEPLHPSHHGGHGDGDRDRWEDGPPCDFVLRNDLMCGYGSEVLLPTLVIVERSKSFGSDDSTDVIYSVGPGLARVDYAGGTILLDEPARRVSFFDAEQGTWSSQPLEDWQAHVDSLTEWTRTHARSDSFKFRRTGPATLVSEYECRAYHVSLVVEMPDGVRDAITQQVWVTRDVETTQEIYTTYRHALALFDNQWLDVPLDRPAGIVFRTREARLSTPRAPGEGAHIEEASVVEIGYRLYPMEFFTMAADPSMGPAASEAYEH